MKMNFEYVYFVHSFTWSKWKASSQSQVEKNIELTRFYQAWLGIYNQTKTIYRHVMNGISNPHAYAHLKIVKLNKRIIDEVKM